MSNPVNLHLSQLDISENYGTGNLVATISADDPDHVGIASYSLIDDANGAFEIIGDGLYVADSSRLDYEAIASGTLGITVRVTDLDQETTDAHFTIAIDDLDEAPVFTSGGGATTWDLDATEGALVAVEPIRVTMVNGTLQFTADPFQIEKSVAVAAPMASDPEGGPLQYRISGGNDAAWFSFGPDAWMTSTDDPQPLLYFHSTIVGSFPDFEHPADGDKDNVYEVTITASDGVYEAAQAIRLTITNDSSKGPVFTHSLGFPYFALAAVMENTTAVTTITATPDHAGDPVTYALNDNAGFSIDPTTGALSFNVAPDYEAISRDSFLVVAVTATAGGHSTSEAVYVVVMNANDAPTDIALAAHAVRESAANGTVVGTLAGVDQDSHETCTYALLDDAGGRFALGGPSNDEVVVANGLALDFEQHASHRITVEVTDSHGATFTKALTVDVSNVDPEAITGTSADETFVGGAHADKLDGRAGKDTLKGGGGSDTLYGGLGADRLYAGVDNLRDKLVYGGKDDSGKTAATWDNIFQFDKAANGHDASSDKIDLHLIDADAKAGDQAFRFVMHFTRPAAGQSHGEVMVVPSGPDQKVEIDFDGNRSVDSVILVHHVGALHGYDFVL